MTQPKPPSPAALCPTVVAIKSRPECKSRLAVALTPESRVWLVRTMLDGVLQALSAARSVGPILVVSPERDAVPDEFEVISDAGGGLNTALEFARGQLLARGAREMLILPADLPLIAADDVDSLIDLGRTTGFALATDAAGAGTNALYVDARAPFHFQFGANSSRQHLREATRLGLTGNSMPHLPPRYFSLQFDIDSPADLDRLRELNLQPYAMLAALPAAPDSGRCG